MRHNLRLAGVYFGGHEDNGQLDAQVHGFFRASAAQTLEVVIDRRFARSTAAQAHQYLERTKILGRVVLIPG